MNGRRIIFLDNLKTLVIALVVVFHGAMSYMAYAPEWWYVLDDERSLAATVFVVWADVFIMPVMFFISGYFGAAFLAGTGSFWKSKWKRVGLPWLFGSVCIAPYIAYLYMLSRSVPMTFYQFYMEWFWGVFYQQAQYWYLGFLMALYGLLYLSRRLCPAWLQPSQSRFSLTVFFGCAVLCALGMGAMLQCYDDAVWIHPLYVLCFQPTRAPLYLVVFGLGAYAWRSRWFSQGQFASPAVWGAAFAVLSVVYTAFRFDYGYSWQELPYYSAVFAVLHSLFCLTAVAALTALFQRFADLYGPWGRQLSSLSYGVYYIHQVVVMHVVWLLRPWDGGVYAKYAVMCVLSLCICALLSRYVLSRIPSFSSSTSR